MSEASARGLTRYVGLAEAIELQVLLCRRFGGDSEVVDPGLVEGVLARCRSPHYRTLAEQAAAILHGLADERAMRSANARFAFALAASFLRLNGYRLDVSPTAASHFLREQLLARRADVRRVAQALDRTLQRA